MISKKSKIESVHSILTLHKNKKGRGGVA